jgi:alpha-mannosidase
MASQRFTDQTSASIRSTPATVVLYAVGNAHIDPVWQWDWREGCSEVLSTFRSAVQRMKEYPEFIFSAGSAQHYRWVEELDPELFTDIKRYVREGRWEIVNGWWVQPDCNIPSAESFVRHSLYGKRYFREKFGVEVTVGYNVDSFGHCSVIPQILAQSGFTNYVHFRPSLNELKIPKTVFRWRSPDGSEILASRPPNCDYQVVTFYNTGPDDLTVVLDGHIRRVKEYGESVALFFYGVGNHGGGPTRANIESIRSYAAAHPGVTIHFSTLRRFFDAVAPHAFGYPVMEGELQYFAVGCYTSVLPIKQLNRRCERMLYTAELFAALAHLYHGHRYPKERLTAAWEYTLFNQFHDILAGSAVGTAYDHARESGGAALHAARETTNAALRAIAHTALADMPFTDETEYAPCGTAFVFNPLPRFRDGFVEVHVLPYRFETEQFEFSLDDIPVPAQAVRHNNVERPRTLVRIERIPPCGFAVLTWRPRAKDAPSATPALPSIAASCRSLETDEYRLSLDDAGGVMIHDKRTDVDVFSNPSCVGVVLDDDSDAWGTDVTAYPEESGRFMLTRAYVREAGPLRAILTAQYRFRDSLLEQDFTVYRGSREIDVRCRLSWRQKAAFLKMRFDVNVTDPVCTSSVPGGSLQRPADGMERPCQEWVDLSGRSSGKLYGLAIINDGLYGYDARGARVRISVVRSPVYIWAKFVKLDPAQHYHHMDIGEHAFAYRLLPHSGDWRTAGVVDSALAFNTPLEYVTYTYQHRMPARGTLNGASLLEVIPETVTLQAVKQAEDGEDLIIRLQENAGVAAHGEIRFERLRFSVPFDIEPHQIKTVRISRARGAAPVVRAVNLLEE